MLKYVIENNIKVCKDYYCEHCGERIPWTKWQQACKPPRFIKSHVSIGRHSSKETRDKISKNHADVSGENNPMFGTHRVHSEETIKKMRESHTGKNNHMYGKAPPEGTTYGIRCYYWNPVQGDVCFRSTYELAYAKYLDKKHIAWVYERKAFPLSNGTTYRPDFYLLKKQKYIEIKGYITHEAYTKIKLFIEEYPNINYGILCKDDLVRKGII